MPLPSHQTGQHAASSQQKHQQDQYTQSQPIGRSQSTFNFLLSKAKAPFSSSASSSQLNASTSMSSLSTVNDDPFDDTTNHIPYHRQLQQEHTFPHAPSGPAQSRRRPSGNLEHTSRAEHQNNNNHHHHQHTESAASRAGTFARPSYSEDAPGAVASPTKRGFFSGIGRDRKASNASLKQPVPQKNFTYSPLSKGQRSQPSTTGNYAHFSRSQTDLHSRADISSPTETIAELPRVPAIYQQAMPTSADSSSYLRSPSPALNFAVSVEDLSSTEQCSAGYDASTSTPATAAPAISPGTWAEHGMPDTQSHWRPSDMGTLSSPSQQTIAAPQRFKVGQNKVDSGASHLQPYTASLQSPSNHWHGMSPPQSSYMQATAAPRADAKHARKVSKLTGNHTGRSAVASSLAASLGLAHLGGSAAVTVPMSTETSSEPVSLPSGAVFQGFVNRNANISLTLAQLSGHDYGKGKEKDIAKGWKPYRVVLQDGKLYFYKPPNNVSDEVKALFPNGIVRNIPDTPASSVSVSSLNVDVLMKSGLNKQDLLSATSSSTEMTSPLSSPRFRPRPPAPRSNGNKSGATSAEAPATPVTPFPVPPVVVDAALSGHRAWVKPGKHPDLVLVDAIDGPQSWVERIQSGSVAALAHEFVKATQMPTVNETMRAAGVRRSIASPLFDSVREGGPSDRPAETFVVAVFVSIIIGQRAAQPASDQHVEFLSEVRSRAEEALLALAKESQSNIASELKTRLATLIDVAVRAGIAQTSAERDVLQGLADLIQLQSEDISAKLVAFAAPVVHAEPIRIGKTTDWVKTVADTDDNDTREDLRQLRSSLAISDELLLQLEPLEIAQQIQLFHADALRRLASGGLTLCELLEAAKSERQLVGALSFDSLSPHPLTTLTLKHLLFSSSNIADAANAAQNGARHRASVLRHWIAVASYLLTLGDIAGWIAVSAALCSRAVTRLEQTWRFLAEGDRVLVAEEWAPILSSISWTEGLVANVRPRFVGHGAECFVTLADGRKTLTIPFLGNALYRTTHPSPVLGSSPAESDQIPISSRTDSALGLWTSVNEWRAAWKQPAVDSNLAIAAQSEALAEYQATLQLLFRDAAQTSSPNFHMEQSFQLEPKALGVFSANGRRSLPVDANPCLPLVPLLFPQPLPLLSLVDAAQIIAELSRRDEQRITVSKDRQATIRSRSLPRSGIAESPLLRSAAFSPSLGGRSSRTEAFAGVIEWCSLAPVPTREDQGNNDIKIGNELVLRVVQEANLSLPNSPITGKRFSSDFGRHSRPLSQLSKRSSLPASNRSSVIDIVVPVQVVVKAATLDRIIDLLVMGVQHVTVPPSQSISDATEPQTGPARKTKLVMDTDSFRTTFLATFRSLCSPPELLEQLRKRFHAAITASKELSGANEFLTSSQFPSWIPLTPAGSQAEPTDWDLVYRIRMGVVLTLRLWIDRFPQDFVDDDVLYQLTWSFLRHPGMEATAEDPDQQKITNAIAQLRSMFGARIMGANARQEERSYATDLPVHVTSDQHQPGFDFDRANAAELVEYLESIATVFFDKIVDRDLLVVSEIFEKRAGDPASWFTVKSSATGAKEEDKSVTNMYTMLDVLKACDSTTNDGSNGVTLQQKLPSAVRDALAAQSLFRGWIAIHIIESGIGLERRQERISKLLDALWICRARMLRLRADGNASSSNHTSSNLSSTCDQSLPFREPTIGSFVESAIVNTLGSSESRIFLRAWQGVVAARGGKGDNLDDLVPKHVDPEMRSAAQLSGTPDIGWVLACLAEAATKAPSVHTSAGDIELVDFDKRRTLWALIDGAVRVRPACSVPGLVDLAGARLRLMQTALTRVIWDRRAFREDAANEMRNAPPVRSDARLHPSSSSKALTGLSKQQQEKLRRDRMALEMLESMPLRPSITNRVSSMPSSNSRSSTATSPAHGSTSYPAEQAATLQVAPPDKATIRARRMTALFKGAVRPLITLDKPDTPAKSISELMRLTPLQKPSIIAGLGGARVSVWSNAQRSFVFHLTSQEGAKYLLQTNNATELAEWVSHIEKASTDYAASNPMYARKGSIPHKSKPVQAPLYGRSLVELVEREGHSVPTAVERMFAEIEARGLREQGIYRISGSKSAVENLRRAFDQQPADSVDLSTGDFSDIHTICGAVKTWLRELPEPLITFDSYDEIIATNAMENDDRLYAMRDIIWRMPKCHFDALRRTAEHLARVVEEGEINKMLAHNIALVFGTSLLNPPPGPSSVAIGFGNLGKAANVVKTIVTMHEWLFEPEPEPEVEPEVQTPGQEEQIGDRETLIIESAGSEEALAHDHDGATYVAPANPARPRGASLSSGQDSLPEQVGDSTTVQVSPQHQTSGSANEDVEEDEPLAELAVRSRRGGRGRPLTIVGLDGLSAFGGAQDVAKVLESGEPSATKTHNVAETLQSQANTSADTQLSEASIDSEAAPRIVLSESVESEDDTGNESQGDVSNDALEVDNETQQANLGMSEDDDPSPGLAVASERPRKTRSTYRDSVFTSYSIYADCFDSMKLESQTSAASMVKRQSVHLLGPQPSGEAEENKGQDA